MKYYRNLLLFALISLFSGEAAHAQSAPNPPTFKAGGTPIILPGPENDFVEVGDEYRSVIFELMVPTSNRLISAYVRDQDLPMLKGQRRGVTMPTYAMIQVLRRAEYADCSIENFREVVNGANQSMESTLMSASKDMEAEFNRRMKALDLNTLQIGEVKQVGSFFDKPNAYGFGLITVVNQGDHSTKVAAATVFLRVQQ